MRVLHIPTDEEGNCLEMAWSGTPDELMAYAEKILEDCERWLSLVNGPDGDFLARHASFHEESGRWTNAISVWDEAFGQDVLVSDIDGRFSGEAFPANGETAGDGVPAVGLEVLDGEAFVTFFINLEDRYQDMTEKAALPAGRFADVMERLAQAMGSDAKGAENEQ